MNICKYADKMKYLNPIDDEFFKKMAEDKNFCQEVLRIVMEDPGLITGEKAVILCNIYSRCCMEEQKTPYIRIQTFRGI